MKNYATTGLWQKTDPEIDRRPIDEMLSLMAWIHEHLTDPNGLLDKKETRGNLLRLQGLCGCVAADINAVLNKSI
jgi:hypothetical protein